MRHELVFQSPHGPMLPPTRTQRARGKQTSQQATDSSFAAYFESRNLPVPSGLRPLDSNNDAASESSRTRKRQRVGDELDMDRLGEDNQLVWPSCFNVPIISP
jgi:hypothetical protein